MLISALVGYIFILFNPTNFDDCILKGMRGVSSDVAGRAIYQSCKSKFPEKEVKRNIRQLTPSEVSMINGRGGQSYSQDYYDINLLNSNSKVTISKVTFKIDTFIDKKEVSSRNYDVDLTIPPNKTGNAFFKFIPGNSGATYGWTPIAAMGFE